MTEIEKFISNIESSSKRNDSIKLLALLEDVSGYNAHLSGSIIGFGRYHYKYESGREGESSVIAFSPRKQNLTVYIMPGFSNYKELLALLGKYKLGKSCLYINKLQDIDLRILKKIAKRSVQDMNEKHECKNT